ncbi:hypothetical protein VP01_567g6 [Puccinia sorghi]|uniref:Uncharacterized protein n=1 Tax=Puccinia sorghi TaxID=27349 RepID=A0A0L6UJI5_9BASI|nr:hypothetical protein VP01_567g6 [Puccinia sorghi]
MAVSKAALAQRERRKKQSKSEAEATGPFKDQLPRPTNSQQDVIQEMIDPLCPQELPTIIGDQDEDLIFKIYEEEVALINESHQILDYKINQEGRILKSGTSNYLMPIRNPSNNYEKLIPRKLPQTTKHHYKNQALWALGKSKNFGLELNSSAIKNQANSNKSGGFYLVVGLDLSPTLPATVCVNCISPVQKKNNNNKKEVRESILKPPKIYEQVQFKQDFDELNQTIAYLKLEFKNRCKKDPYPAIELDENQEFNNLKFFDCCCILQSPTSYLLSIMLESSSNQCSQIQRNPIKAPTKKRKAPYPIEPFAMRYHMLPKLKLYLIYVAELCKYPKKYKGTNCKVPILIEPDLLPNDRETVFIYQKKSTVALQKLGLSHPWILNQFFISNT